MTGRDHDRAMCAARPGERRHPRVRIVSTPQVAGVNAACGVLARTRVADDARASARRPVGTSCVEGSMADLAYAVLLIGGFAVLVLTLRGLDSL